MELRAVLFLRLNASSNFCDLWTSSSEEVRLTEVRLTQDLMD